MAVSFPFLKKVDVRLENIVASEVAQLPSSPFDEYGFMRKSNKSPFISKLFFFFFEYSHVYNSSMGMS